MIVIDVLRVGTATDGAHAPLLGRHLIEVDLPDAVARTQVIFAVAAVQALFRLLATRVVAWLQYLPWPPESFRLRGNSVCGRTEPQSGQ